MALPPPPPPNTLLPCPHLIACPRPATGYWLGPHLIACPASQHVMALPPPPTIYYLSRPGTHYCLTPPYCLAPTRTMSLPCLPQPHCLPNLICLSHPATHSALGPPPYCPAPQHNIACPPRLLRPPLPHPLDVMWIYHLSLLPLPNLFPFRPPARPPPPPPPATCQSLLPTPAALMPPFVPHPPPPECNVMLVPFVFLFLLFLPPPCHLVAWTECRLCLWPLLEVDLTDP